MHPEDWKSSRRFYVCGDLNIYGLGRLKHDPLYETKQEENHTGELKRGETLCQFGQHGPLTFLYSSSSIFLVPFCLQRWIFRQPSRAQKLKLLQLVHTVPPPFF